MIEKDNRGDVYFTCCEQANNLDIHFYTECGVIHMSKEGHDDSFTLEPVKYCPFCAREIPKTPDSYHERQKGYGYIECLSCRGELT